MVSVPALSVIDLGFETDGVKPMIIKLECVASPLRKQHLRERIKTRWLGIRIMCQKGGAVGAICKRPDCCLSELAL